MGGLLHVLGAKRYSQKRQTLDMRSWREKRGQTKLRDILETMQRTVPAFSSPSQATSENASGSKEVHEPHSLTQTRTSLVQKLKHRDKSRQLPKQNQTTQNVPSNTHKHMQ